MLLPCFCNTIVDMYMQVMALSPVGAEPLPVDFTLPYILLVCPKVDLLTRQTLRKQCN